MNTTNGTRYKNSVRFLGFTLTEVLVVIAILALLASVLAVNYTGILGGAKRKIASQEISRIKELVEQYKFITGSYPTSQDGLKVLTKEMPNHQEALVNNEKILDPWGNEYIYVYPGNHGRFDIISYGADGVEGGDGENADVISWQETQSPQ